MNEFVWFWVDSIGGTLYDYFVYAGIAFVLFYFVLRKVMHHRKIQQKYPKLSDYRRDLIFSLITMSIFATIAVLVFDVYFEQTNMYREIDERGMVYYVLSFLGMFFIHDTYFYWIHRMMHLPRFYKSIHLVHQEPKWLVLV